MAVPGQSTKEIAASSAHPAMQGMALWVFSYVASASLLQAVPCLHLSRAGVDAGYTSPLRSPWSSFPSAVIFRSFTRSDFAVSPPTPVSRVRQAAASLCAPASPPYRPVLWRHGTARCRGICEQRRKTSCSMRNLSLLNVEECDRLSFFCLTCLATIFCMPRRMCTRWRKNDAGISGWLLALHPPAGRWWLHDAGR